MEDEFAVVSVMPDKCLPYAYTSELALNSNLAEQILYFCSIAQCCFDHLPRGGDEGSTRAPFVTQQLVELLYFHQQ